MKGIEYFSWFTKEEKSKWLNNFIQQDVQSDFCYFMERSFPKYHIFFFLGFDIHKSNEGGDYWLNIFYRNKKFDNMYVKPGFSFKGEYKQPKIF